MKINSFLICLRFLRMDVAQFSSTFHFFSKRFVLIGYEEQFFQHYDGTSFMQNEETQYFQHSGGYIMVLCSNILYFILRRLVLLVMGYRKLGLMNLLCSCKLSKHKNRNFVFYLLTYVVWTN